MDNELFHGQYRNKRVLVTGHTGFKGSWLSLWLKELGAEVYGFSKYLPSEPNHFEAVSLSKQIHHHSGDIRNFDELQSVFKKSLPEVVFHLAAQPIVRDSYSDPRLTFETNLMGTVNVLECIRHCSSVKVGVIITSDKCYENDERDVGYHEDDRLGGADPYSASKACAEIAFSAYYRSFFGPGRLILLSTARAGNVIGGGDWAKDRIVPDCVRAWSRKQTATIRNPQATRPWQHVLEPLSGYLWLGALLVGQVPRISGEAFNFGPHQDVVKSVEELVHVFNKYWLDAKWQHIPEIVKKKEATLLQLDCKKAKEMLNWHPVLNFEQTIAMTAQWYKGYYEKKTDPRNISIAQINEYVHAAKESHCAWTKPQRERVLK